MEQTDSNQRGGGGDSGGKKGKEESKNKYEWTAVDMDMAYSVGIDGGSRR